MHDTLRPRICRVPDWHEVPQYTYLGRLANGWMSGPGASQAAPSSEVA
jgi:hypothetical protein